VIEDIKAVRERAKKAEAEVERLNAILREALADRNEWMTRALVAGSKEGK
jgi:hypothetical protein